MVEVVQTKTIMRLARETADFRVKEQYWKNISEIHAKIVELSLLFNIAPEKVIESLMMWDSENK